MRPQARETRTSWAVGVPPHQRDHRPSDTRRLSRCGASRIRAAAASPVAPPAAISEGWWAPLCTRSAATITGMNRSGFGRDSII